MQTRSPDTTTLYIGNLPRHSSEEEIRSIFAGFGRVHSVKLVRDRMTGQSRGFGFIEMDSGRAEAARRKLNQYRFGGHVLRVDAALDRSVS